MGPLDDAPGSDTIGLTFTVQAADADGDTVNTSFTVDVQDDVPIAGMGAPESVKEANLPDGSSPDVHDLAVTGSLNIAWGADSNDSGTTNNRSVGFQHDTQHATASADVQVTDGSNDVITGLTSNGHTVQYGIFNGVLVGYVNNDPLFEKVFTVSLNDNGSGSYTFTLLNNLDHPTDNGNNTLNLTFDFTATDADGDISSNTFTVTVVDDVPTAHVGDAGFVNEANLPNGTAPLFFAFPSTSGDLNIVWGADNNDSGSTNNRSVTFQQDTQHSGASADVQVTDSGGNSVTGLTSDGNTVNYTFINGALVGYIGSVNHPNIVFTVSLNDAGDGSYTFTLLGNLDHPTGLGTNLLNFTFDYTATDSDGDTSSSNFTVSVKDSVPLAFSVGLQTVGEEGLADGNHIFGDAHNASTGVTSLNISWGADANNPTVGGGTHDRSVVFASTTMSDFNNLNLTSNGQTITYMITQDSTGALLTATAGSDSHKVFTVQLSDASNGSYNFTLLDNLDHATGNGTNFDNLTFNVVATDSDGDPVSQSFTVGVQDDVPILVGNVMAETVSEGGLPGGNSSGAKISLTEALNINWGADQATQPTDTHGRSLSFLASNGTTAITGSNALATNLDMTFTGEHGAALTSGGVALVYTVTANTNGNGGETLTAYAGSVTGPEVFTLTLDPTQTHGGYVFNLLGTLDDASNSSSIALNFTVQAADADGDTVNTSFQVTVNDDAPTVTGTVMEETVSEGGLPGGNSQGAAISLTEALNINWGADQATQPTDTHGRSLSFLASNGTTAITGSNALVTNLDMTFTGEHGTALTSGGVALVYTVTANTNGNGGETLTAYAGSVTGPEIFTLTLDPTQDHGGYVFNLMGPLDDASNSNSIGLAFTVQAADADGDTVNTSFQVTVNDDAPTVTGTVMAEMVSEGGLPGGNSQGAKISLTEALNINWGADQATQPTDANGRTLSFLASNGTTAITGSNALVTNLDMTFTGEHGTALTSGGVALVYTVTANTNGNGGETLTAYAGSVTGPVVFTLTLDPTQTHGGYVFNLLGTLDDASNSNSIALNFTVQAADADGDTVNTSFQVNVTDDAPTVTGTVMAETVFEGGLPGGNSQGAKISLTEALNINWGADQAAHPTDANGRTLSFLAGDDTTPIAGGSSLVTNLAMTILGEQGTALSSGGVALVYTVTANTNGNGGETLTAYAGSTMGPEVFTLTLDPTQTHGGYVFNLMGPLDDASNPNSNSIGLTFTVQAADADGDTVNTSFTVNVTDDAPTVTGTVMAETVSEGGLPAAIRCRCCDFGLPKRSTSTGAPITPPIRPTPTAAHCRS